MSLFRVFVLAILWPLHVTGPTSADTKPLRHSWSEIVYPSIWCDWATTIAEPSLRVPEKDERQGLQFCLTFYREPSGLLETQRKFVQPETKKIKVRLHLADGTMVEPEADDSSVKHSMIWSSRGRGVFKKTFNWQKNDLQEAWLELRFPGHAYWLGIPYGFTRNPNDPLCAASSAGKSKLAPAMKLLEKRAKLVAWKYVEYGLNLGNENHVLRQSNLFDAESELILQKKNLDLVGWDLFSPRSSVYFQQGSGKTLRGDLRSITKHGPVGERRSDYFKFPRNRSSKVRNWGTVSVTVGDFKTEIVTPSSLFKYGHGVTDTLHDLIIRDQEALEE